MDPETPETPETLTVREVAAFLRVDRKTVYTAVSRNQIPFRRVGRKIRFHRAALALWLQGTCKRSSESVVQ